MRALITGANGFVGRHLLAHLRDAGDEVVGVDRSDGDLVAAGAADAIVARTRPEVIYHLAGAADVGASWHAPVATWEANALATLRTLEAARAHGVQRMVLTSSADVYGLVAPGELPLDEDSPTSPRSPYAASKLAAEAAARQAWLGWGLETIVVRAFNHIGPGQRPDFVAAGLARTIAENERSGNATVSVGVTTPRRDFTDVRDVVRAYRLLAEVGTPGERYCVCSGVDHAVGDLAATLLGLAAAPMELVTDPARIRPVELPVLRGRYDKVAAATGWHPRIPLTESLRAVLDDARRAVATPPNSAPLA